MMYGCINMIHAYMSLMRAYRIAGQLRHAPVNFWYNNAIKRMICALFSNSIAAHIASPDLTLHPWHLIQQD